jgi:hypothetical protein
MYFEKDLLKCFSVLAALWSSDYLPSTIFSNQADSLPSAYFRGYDCILVEDATATTSPTGGFENVVYNAGNVSFLTTSWPT